MEVAISAASHRDGYPGRSATACRHSSADDDLHGEIPGGRRNRKSGRHPQVRGIGLRTVLRVRPGLQPGGGIALAGPKTIND